VAGGDPCAGKMAASEFTRSELMAGHKFDVLKLINQLSIISAFFAHHAS
jgi:hypothetical protein